MARFSRLMEPGRIGSLELRNRIAMCPMGLLFGNDDGTVSDDEAAFYEARARGGAGLLIVGTACVAYPNGTNHERMPGVSDDRFLPGMRMLAERVHRHGARIAAQLNHMGFYGFVDVISGRPRLVPCVPPDPRPDRISTMMTPDEVGAMLGPFTAPGAELGFKVADEDDIAWVVERFADAADRCARAGYDGVEIHAGHGYLIDEFLSPRNTRTDRWGGDIEGRARLLVEVVTAIRARVGRDFPVWIRINGFERHHEVAEQLGDQCRAIELAVAAGIDAVHVTAYASTDVATGATDSYAPHVVGPLADHAAVVRERVGVPVITYGRFEPDEAEAVLAAGKADFVAMGRKLLADPDLPNKLSDDRLDDVRPCIYQYRCIGNISVRTPARCVVNPLTGREHGVRIEPARAPRHVLVVGGGPAGLEAARLLAARGHRVTLREASGRLGGRLVDAAAADPVLDRYLGWLVRQVELAGVVIEVGSPLDAHAVPAGVDEVVVATGATWGVPDVPGAERIRALADLSGWLHGDEAIGQEVAILGDSKAALSIADLCLRRGLHPTVIAPNGYLAPQLGLPGRYRLIADLEAGGASLVLRATVDSVDDGRVSVTHKGEPVEVAFDTAIGLAPRPREDPLPDLRVPVHAIGDCHGLGFIEGATNSALEVALRIG